MRGGREREGEERESERGGEREREREREREKERQRCISVSHRSIYLSDHMTSDTTLTSPEHHQSVTGPP